MQDSPGVLGVVVHLLLDIGVVLNRRLEEVVTPGSKEGTRH